MKILKIAVMAVFLAVFLIACTETAPTDSTNEDHSNHSANATPEAPEPPDELTLGENKYKEHCARCHKDDGAGGKVEIEGKMLDPEDLTSKGMIEEPDEEYIEYMVKGIPDEGMPSFREELTDDEMKAVVKFIRVKLQKQ